jgi:hypothetical protein
MGLFRQNTYKCEACGTTGCKLWREHGVYSRVILKCAPCAAKEQKRDISTIDADGMRLTPEYDWAGDRRSDQIGWYVPAVQFKGQDGVYCTPNTEDQDDSYEVWRKLPTLPK